MTSMRSWIVLAVTALVMVRAQSAEACACCDAKMKRTPIGWSDEGAILIDEADNHACEPKARYETWNVDGQEPTRCYDLYGDPEKDAGCDTTSSTELPPGTKPKKTSIAAKKKFAKPAKKMAAAKFRVKQTWAEPDSPDALNVVVEVKSKVGWQELWTGSIQPTTNTKKVKLDVSLWPNVKGDRVLLLLGYIENGTGNQQVDVKWAAMPKTL